MPIIENFSNFLESEVLKTPTGYDYKLGLFITPQSQRGQICKLNALSVVLNALHKIHDMPKPPPLRKDKNHPDSLRQQAKERYGSTVGEIYSAKTLAQIAADNGYDHSSVVTANSFTDYNWTIIRSVNSGEAPILFYDIDLEGEPARMKSHREHAAVVVGYYVNKKQELGFIVSQGGNYYWAKAEDIYLSTNQLNPNRASEVFWKLDNEWYDLYNLRFSPQTLFSQPSDQRLALPLPLEDGGLKNKVLIIHNKPKLVPKNSFWSPSPLKLNSDESTRLFSECLDREHIPYQNTPGQ
ncbi:hypothetical protein TUM19329_11580 [Legionella antarctica]|uniref:Peptidase C39-like domain-containing protein n=1 Tax=Legionella antarctica TaxID=2708020 RepID=A0A6F8T3Q5_9GAMM|nr:hypothetical protein [Legionella antarctica]BCA94797.1 hypothetical protein TUM19329_11580 [Legionella antarctica]